MYNPRLRCIYNLRGISEFIALLVVIAVAVAVTVAVISFLSTSIAKHSPRLRYLEASVAGIEVLREGADTVVEFGTSSFTARYIYQVTIIVHNAGTETISNLQYRVIDVDQNIDTCTSDQCEIYDPIVFTTRYTRLPSSLLPNSASSITITVLSKVDLLRLGYSPFVIEITGTLPDGSRVSAEVAPFGA